jgi:hypothetical protein
MSKSKRNIRSASAASMLAMFAMTGAALAQETTDTYGIPATETQPNSSMEQDQAKAAKRMDEARQLAATFGVSELNDIENWKITNSGQELGEIDRIGIDASTGEILAVVGLEGVTGVNMKEVGIPLSKLRKSGDESLSTELTKDELQRKRDIDPWDGSYSQVLKDGMSQ